MARSLLLSGAYFSWVQNRVVQAQYFKDPKRLKSYFEHSIFLPDLNNELESKNLTYATNLKSLKRFVVIKFSEEQILSPPETANVYRG
ncbi:hypothetical protein HK096_001803 [Nowakowskiella sp. JEL0078]|nr:hypothetical protein HK096_001803 [Nowakowskiella sp. JEL0078]